VLLLLLLLLLLVLVLLVLLHAGVGGADLAWPAGGAA
jgi:hypothetical protein